MGSSGIQVRGVGKWLQNAHRRMKRTEQELEVRGLLKCLGLEYEEQRALLLGEVEGRPGVKLEVGESWVIVDFYVKVIGKGNRECDEEGKPRTVKNGADGDGNGDGNGKGKGIDVIIECSRLEMGRSRRRLMDRVRQRAAQLNMKFFEIKRRYDVKCIALMEAPVNGLVDYLRPRMMNADFIVSSVEELRDVLKSIINGSNGGIGSSGSNEVL